MQNPDRSFFNRRSIRLRDYDYSQTGLYFVTICTYHHTCIFGYIRQGQMLINELGKLVQNHWLQIPVSRANTELDAFVVMPNHLHGIIKIIGNERCRRPAANMDDRTSRAATLPSGSLGATIGQFKSIVTKRCRMLTRPPTTPIWQRNYYEHIIRNESALDDIRKYIFYNPARWADDDLYVE